ncbi:Vps54 domain-containing protein [Trichophyton interdigitale]|uniref:Vps54 domain-containing protein n=1 Tax=Trichophyton interdigitale TaxID=101480 RepID=A0A9P4YJU5_9EURO|nr:Vps54 domain-containing protein [Trichophyton interdigitale]KAF3900403.1 Vps54 domain-containing protein [Trichophyton interdigitale]
MPGPTDDNNESILSTPTRTNSSRPTQQGTAGLTNINTKHLALTSQSLSFFITLIPYLRESVRRKHSIICSLEGYDRLKCLFQEHRSSIHHKLVDIMSFRATLYFREMEKIKWDDEDEVQRTVSPYIETLNKEALTLERVLGKYLPTSNMEIILNQVFESYREQWSKAFEEAVILTEAGKSRLLRDAELLQAKLDKIDGSKELGAHMINIVKAKQISSRPESSRSEPSG